MSQLDYPTYFQNATGSTPYPYQIRLACGEPNDRPESDWLTSGAPCHSRLIAIPTGLGKTAAVNAFNLIKPNNHEYHN